MALNLEQKPRIPDDDIRARFGIAQDASPVDEQERELQLQLQRALREMVADIAALVNTNIADSRAKSLALTAFEEALMWSGKAIFEPEGIQ